MTADPRPTVDVVVVTWNTAELTVRALRHLLDTDQGVELRILVHDNASEDGTADAIEAEVPEAEVVRGGENLGFAGGVNAALARSTAPWILLLNSDAWPRPGAIGQMITAAEAEPRHAAIAPRLERPDGTLEHSTHPFPSVSLAAVLAAGGDRWLPERVRERLCLEGAWHHTTARTVDWAVGAALLIRRAALDAVGPLDERFFMYAEDLAWCWQAHREGWTIGFEPDAVVIHVGNASGERRYGHRRTKTYLQNTDRWYRDAHGPAATRLYRAMNRTAARREQLTARLRGDAAAADWWGRIVDVHRQPIPDDDPSRP